ncbi:MAG: MtrB/PioB family outer membrane beta-barrel protein [Desulfobulbaceae bacterium]|nr:MtrB/PioB family outer membrane beta-barrel protein [Desulfobulbaceae bacterium]
MRYKKTNCIFSIYVIGLALCCTVSPAMAAEDPLPPKTAETTAEPGQEESAVSYATEGNFFLGYRWVSNKDSLQASKYIYPHSSVAFGLDLLSCPLPFRYHVNAEFLSNYNYYTDAGFAYKDLVLFRDIVVGVHHNLNHVSYQQDDDPPEITYTDRNAGDDYYIDFASNLLSLRLKVPDFPFHTFLKHRHIERDGKIQQRFLLGDFDQLNKNSESRDIDWKSDAMTLGANSHVGPIEVEYSYDQAKFKPGSDSILYDSYPAALDLSRPADVYPHNVVPETESSAHAIKLHSSYTGGIVTAATVSNLYQKNNYSGTESTTWKGAFDVSWIPAPPIGFFFKYRHRDVDMDTPSAVSLIGQSNSFNYSVRQGISYDKDEFSLSARYKPLNSLTLFANYDFSHLSRENVNEWIVLPDETDIHTINFTAHVSPLKKVKVKAGYEYKNYDNPAYNSTPDNSNKLRLTTTYIPTHWIYLYLEYILSMTERDSLHYLNNSPSLLLETGERDGRHDQFLASLTAQLSAKTSLTASWFYQRWDVEQDLAYGKWLTFDLGDLPYIDVGVPYTDKSNSFCLSLQYFPRKDITLTADATYTISEGKTGYDDVVGGAPFSLSSFSALKSSETIFSVEITKKISKEWEIGVRSHMEIYNDKAYDFLDGNVFTTIFGIKRYF